MHEIYYMETNVSVGNITNVRFLFVIAVLFDLEHEQMGAVPSFMH